jgi:hypothetical protein
MGLLYDFLYFLAQASSETHGADKKSPPTMPKQSDGGRIRLRRERLPFIK